MNFQSYEEEAAKSDCIPLTGREKLQFLVLGLNEEAGEIARIVKKFVRDDIVEETVAEDLKHKIGDTLWYLCAIARNSNITMSDVAERNLTFLNERWLTNYPCTSRPGSVGDSKITEQFPETLSWRFIQKVSNGIVKVSVIDSDGQQIGNSVDDNAYQHEGDGYRFHDAIHLVLMAHFGWSPVLRKLLKVKRKSNTEIDRVDDGARARDIEESISHRMFVYMRRHSYLEGVRIVDTSFLRNLREESRGREIASVTERRWELAMLEAAHVIRQLIKHGGGYVIADNLSRHVIFKPALGVV